MSLTDIDFFRFRKVVLVDGALYSERSGTGSRYTLSGGIEVLNSQHLFRAIGLNIFDRRCRQRLESNLYGLDKLVVSSIGIDNHQRVMQRCCPDCHRFQFKHTGIEIYSTSYDTLRTSAGIGDVGRPVLLFVI